MVPDTVLGKVASLAALELLSEPIGDAAMALALSSHVSHAASVLTLAMLGALCVLAAFLCPVPEPNVRVYCSNNLLNSG